MDIKIEPIKLIIKSYIVSIIPFSCIFRFKKISIKNSYISQIIDRNELKNTANKRIKETESAMLLVSKLIFVR